MWVITGAITSIQCINRVDSRGSDKHENFGDTKIRFLISLTDAGDNKIKFLIFVIDAC